MKIKKIKPPRFFQVGLKKNKIFIYDLMHIKMKPKDIVEVNKSIKVKSEEWGFFIENNVTKNNKLKFIFAGSHYNKIHLRRIGIDSFRQAVV